MAVAQYRAVAKYEVGCEIYLLVPANLTNAYVLVIRDIPMISTKHQPAILAGTDARLAAAREDVTKAARRAHGRGPAAVTAPAVAGREARSYRV